MKQCLPSGWEVDQIALAGAANRRQRGRYPGSPVYRGGKIMRSVLGRLVIWVAERLERSLIAVPEVDDDFLPFAADCHDHGFQERWRTSAEWLGSRAA